MTTAIYPGSFDPMTNGHVDIVERASRLFTRVIVAVLNNPEKHPVFAVDERIELICKATEHLANVEVSSFQGLLVDYVDLQQADCVIRGLRSVADFEVEFPMAQMNRHLKPRVVTLFIPSAPAFNYVSSSLVKDIARHGGDLNGLVPLPVAEALRMKYSTR
ncbi:MAG: pantetheine-phosphate adenylyltransferase [Alicyclobacillus sp.]|nr:pantetheine-phosphate adenylyltransferase [Alicyclobacillus sp.]